MTAVAAIQGRSTAHAARSGGGMSFGEVLSCLNPLQYVPVVGMIYRAVTGDTIPAPVREVGSLIFSGLTSGPVGIGISLGVDAAERMVGFDEEKFGQRILAAAGIGHGGTATPTEAATKTARFVAPVSTQPSGEAFTAAELAQFGLTRGPDGSLAGQGFSGADALNAMELGRIGAAAYAKADALSPRAA